MVQDGACSLKIDSVTQVLDIPNLKGHKNHILFSKVTVILLNGWILPFGGVALERLCARLQPV